MTFWEHLEELRRRIIISAIVIGVFAVVSLSLRVPIMKVLRRPIETPLNMQLVTLIDRTVGFGGFSHGVFIDCLECDSIKPQGKTE